MKKAEIVFIPSPGVGHLFSTVEFATLLINHNNRLRITVIVIKFPNTTTQQTDLPISDSLQIINPPECSLPPTSNSVSPFPALLQAQKPNIKKIITNLQEQYGSLTAIVVDMFCTTMIDIAKEFSIPSFIFFTSSVASLGLMLHLHTIRERDNIDSTKLQELTQLAIPSFAKSVPSNSLPTFSLRKEWESFFMNYAGGLKKADGIIVNSFEELESHAVRSFYTHPDFSKLPIYPVGPIFNPDPKTRITVDSDRDIIKWLDDQATSSVVFLCFGSKGCFNQDQVKEIAIAIENSGAHFIWSLRKPSPKGILGETSDYVFADLVSLLPDGFLDRTVEIGRVIGWAPQAQILAHPATGGFVSHCGWNSTLESVYFGVPIATWPLSAEQQTNAFELVCELKMGVEISLDYRVEYNGVHSYLLTADKIEKGIRSVLDKEGDVRKKVKEMSEKSKKTLLEGGSSYAYLGRFIDHIMKQLSN